MNWNKLTKDEQMMEGYQTDYEHAEKQGRHVEAATSRMERNHGTDTSILLVADGSPEQEIRPNQPADSDGGKDGANLSVEEKTYRPKDWAQEGIALMCEGKGRA